MDNQSVENLLQLGGLFEPGKIALLALGIFILWGVNRAARHLSDSLMDKLPSQRFLTLQVITLFSFIWYIGGTYWLLVTVIEPPKEFLLAIGGSAVVAIGFALKDIAASMIAGIMLLFDRPFQVGDRVAFGDDYGEIVSIGLRSVRLRTLDDNMVTIPNSRFITETVSSGNTGALDMMVVTEFYLSLDADLELAQNLVYEVLATSRFIFLKKPISCVMTEVALADRLAVRLTAKAYVLDVRFEKAFQSDVVMRVERQFRAHHIARPQRDGARESEAGRNAVASAPIPNTSYQPPEAPVAD
ncbi:mechanosensitive ion channel [Hahella sp. KA22]|uniref:mechanosensitive ion channel family protein n=1 Tax=Hahella sp. KA22 TaxID=1628392 RepID=UPI000FDE8E57|nr:mechanosensitive ion channel domain-containing protein [Hahella sp. KA22]AZZ95081.1 mechanosensitive ion channel [Hahella sp. KA22]QAY52726.1 mechanosensitive ion channel [Hahella sp. KA22]